jgi:hypothetical protein
LAGERCPPIRPLCGMLAMTAKPAAGTRFRRVAMARLRDARGCRVQNR